MPKVNRYEAPLMTQLHLHLNIHVASLHKFLLMRENFLCLFVLRVFITFNVINLWKLLWRFSLTLNYVVKETSNDFSTSNYNLPTLFSSWDEEWFLSYRVVLLSHSTVWLKSSWMFHLDQSLSPQIFTLLLT